MRSLIRATWSPAPLEEQWLCIHAIESVTSVRLLSVGRLRRGDVPAKACKCALREGCGFVCGGRLKPYEEGAGLYEGWQRLQHDADIFIPGAL